MKQRISLNRFLDPVDDEDYMLTNNDCCLTESDFFPPSDNRVWKSNVNDISGGDNFADYCQYIFGVLEEEEYYDN